MARATIALLLVGAALSAPLVLTGAGRDRTHHANAAASPTPKKPTQLEEILGIGGAANPTLVAFKRKYNRAVTAAAAPVAKRISHTLRQTRSRRTTSWLTKRFGALAHDMRQVHRDLTRLQAPPAVDDAFGRFVASLSRVQRDLATVARNASRADVPGIRSAVRVLVHDLNRTGPPNAALNRKLGATTK